MNRKTLFGFTGMVALVAILAVSVVAYSVSQSATAEPANKAVFTASNMTVIPNTNDNWVTILESTIKTSNPSDLIVQYQQECAIHTELELDSDNEDETSAIREDIRLVVDGNVIPVVLVGDKPVPETDVTLCSRAYHIDTNILSSIEELCGFVEGIEDGDDLECDGEEPEFNSYIATKQSHGWNWVALNVGKGQHDVEIQTKLYDNVITKSKGKKSDSDDGQVHSILEIGLRNMIITEEKLPQNADYPTE